MTDLKVIPAEGTDAAYYVVDKRPCINGEPPTIHFMSDSWDEAQSYIADLGGEG